MKMTMENENFAATKVYHLRKNGEKSCECNSQNRGDPGFSIPRSLVVGL